MILSTTRYISCTFGQYMTKIFYWSLIPYILSFHYYRSCGCCHCCCCSIRLEVWVCHFMHLWILWCVCMCVCEDSSSSSSQITQSNTHTSWLVAARVSTTIMRSYDSTAFAICSNIQTNNVLLLFSLSFPLPLTMRTTQPIRYLILSFSTFRTISIYCFQHVGVHGATTQTKLNVRRRRQIYNKSVVVALLVLSASQHITVNHFLKFLLRSSTNRYECIGVRGWCQFTISSKMKLLRRHWGMSQRNECCRTNSIWHLCK